MVRDGRGRILDCIARLFVRSGLLEDVRRQHVANRVRPMRQQARDRAAPRPWIVDAVALNCQTPGLIEALLIVGRIAAGPFDR